MTEGVIVNVGEREWSLVEGPACFEKEMKDGLIVAAIEIEWSIGTVEE